MSRNSGIFWAIFQGNLLFGNVFVFAMFKGKETIDSQTRLITYGVLTAVGIFGTFLLLALRSVESENTNADSENTEPRTGLQLAGDEFGNNDLLL